MKKQPKLLSTTIATLTLCSAMFGTTTAFAAGNTAAVAPPAGGIQFAAIPTMAPNQNKDIKGYFDLSVQGGQSETLHMTVVNKSDKPMVLDAVPANAVTAANGGIQYVPQDSPETQAALSRQQFQMAGHIKLQNKVSVPAKGSVDVPVQVDVPSALNDGTYLGGVILTQEESTGAAQAPGKQVAFTVQNKVAFAMALQLNLPKSQQQQLTYGGAGVDVIASGVQAYFNLRNENATITDVTKGHYTITDTNGQKMFEGDLNSFRMAPGSDLKFPIFWGNKQFDAGNYNLTVDATYGNGQTLHDTKQFTVKSQQVTTYAQNTGLQKPSVLGNGGNNTLLYAMGGVIVLLIGGMFVILGKRKKNDKKDNAKNDGNKE